MFTPPTCLPFIANSILISQCHINRYALLLEGGSLRSGRFEQIAWKSLSKKNVIILLLHYLRRWSKSTSSSLMTSREQNIRATKKRGKNEKVQVALVICATHLAWVTTVKEIDKLGKHKSQWEALLPVWRPNWKVLELSNGVCW